MLRNRAVLIAVGIIFAAVAAYNMQFFLNRSAPVRERAGTVRTAAPAASGRGAEVLRVSSSQTPRDRAPWRRDPFQLAEKNGPAPVQADRKNTRTGDIRLQGITVRDGRYFALVNGWVVEPGDRIDGLLITGIAPYSIFLKDVQGIREINMYNDISDSDKEK